jgi:uncharacterized protein (TIGR02266 family)
VSEDIPERVSTRRRGEWPVAVDGRERVAIDLSAGGLFVRHLTSFPPGARLRVELGLDDGIVSAGAVVRRVREVGVTSVQPAGTGLAFEDLSDADRARIVALVGREAP